MKTEGISEIILNMCFLLVVWKKNLLKDQITKCPTFHLNVNFLANVSYIKGNDVLHVVFLITFRFFVVSLHYYGQVYNSLKLYYHTTT